MALIVEDGTGLPDAESYVSVANCSTYCVKHGLTFDTAVTADAESALRRATEFLDYTYRQRFPGSRTHRRNQALEWPRTAAYYYTQDIVSRGLYGGRGLYAGCDELLWQYDPIDSATVPGEIINAACQAASLESVSPGLLLTGGTTFAKVSQGASSSAVQSWRTGDTEIRFADSTSSSSSGTFGPAALSAAAMSIIEATLSPLIAVSAYTAIAARR